MDVAYDLRCQSDSMRVTRHSRVSSMAYCPVTEKSVALTVTDSRVVFWEMMVVGDYVSLIYHGSHREERRADRHRQ